MEVRLPLRHCSRLILMRSKLLTHRPSRAISSLGILSPSLAKLKLWPPPSLRPQRSLVPRNPRAPYSSLASQLRPQRDSVAAAAAAVVADAVEVDAVASRLSLKPSVQPLRKA